VAARQDMPANATLVRETGTLPLSYVGTSQKTRFGGPRTRPEITSAFSISSSGRLWPFLNREILIPRLRSGQAPAHYASGLAQSITTKSNLNLSGYHRNLFPDESLYDLDLRQQVAATLFKHTHGRRWKASSSFCILWHIFRLKIHLSRGTFAVALIS